MLSAGSISFLFHAGISFPCRHALFMQQKRAPEGSSALRTADSLFAYRTFPQLLESFSMASSSAAACSWLFTRIVWMPKYSAIGRFR